MTHEKKIENMAIAAAICGYRTTTFDMDLLISLYEFVLEKGGSGTIDEIIEVKYAAKNRADSKARSEMLDKVSEK